MSAVAIRLGKLAALVEQPGEVKRSHAVRVVLARGRRGRSCLAQNKRVYFVDVSRPGEPSRVWSGTMCEIAWFGWLTWSGLGELGRTARQRGQC